MSAPEAAQADASGLEVHFLDIGQGDSALLFCGDETLLIDGGKVKNNQKLIARLKELEVDHLDAVICSHPDEDHCGGLSAVLASTRTDAFYCSVDSWHTKVFSDVTKYVAEQGISVTIPQAGDTFAFSDASVEFLGPVVDYGDDPNEGSLVARVALWRNKLFIHRRHGLRGGGRYVSRGVDVSATVLKVAHHGSAGSSST